MTATEATEPARLLNELVRKFSRRQVEILNELYLNPVPAAELPDEQKAALCSRAGFMHFRDGRFVSIRPVGVCDDGRGGYIVGMAPERTTETIRFRTFQKS